MNHPYDLLETNEGFRFLFTPCPGTKGPSLTESLDQLSSAGAELMITMIPGDELIRLGVESIGQEAQARGMQWFHLPVEDDQAPEQPFKEAFALCKNTILKRVREGATCVVHCRGGTGRTGLITAIILLELGMDWQQVESYVRSVRPNSLTIEAHCRYLRDTYLS